jgi:putative DNA methylase
MKKKLIEVALPLEAINKESAREKSIRHGHPSTLHLWWARRPLAACRAVLFASLVDDPSSLPEQFPTEADQDKERQRLFRLIEKLVLWENSNNRAVLDEARAEILKSTGGSPPPICDPFCGGGSIPLEAQRLGLEAHGSDLNPVAVLITKALIEIPPKFAGQPPVNPAAKKKMSGKGMWTGARGLADDVRYYGQWMRDRAFERIGHLYPRVKLPNGDEATVIAWLWARTVQCPNPACGANAPLLRSFALSMKQDPKTYLEPEIDQTNKTVQFRIRSGSPSASEAAILHLGTSAANSRGKRKKANFRCIFCQSAVIDGHYIDAQAEKGLMAKMPLAVVCEYTGGRLYKEFPGGIHDEALLQADRELKQPTLLAKLPNEPARGTFASNAQGRFYGFHEFKDYFTARQLVTLVTFSDLIGEARGRVIRDGGTESYATAVATYLAFAIDKGLNLWSSLASWMGDRGAMRETFARQALAMTWDFAEANPFSDSGGSLGLFLERVCDALESVPARGVGLAEQLDATALSNTGQTSMFCTDPPYYDNIGYADLSDFFYVWLRRSIGGGYGQLFSTLLVPKTQELIATPYRFEGSKERAQEFFEEGFGKAFASIKEASNPDYPLSVFYAFKQSEADEDEEDSATNGTTGVASTGWQTMLEGLLKAGFRVTGTWPMRTEGSGRIVARGANALASSIVLACRPRSDAAPITTRKDFLASLKKELPQALRNLQKGNIAPVDLAQAAIGPGMAVFSRYNKVLETDGTPMRVRTALALINQGLDEVLSEQESEFDPDTRWALAWFEQHAFDEGLYGEAEVLATAKAISITGLSEAGILHSRAGKVRLLRREELPEDWDPATDRRLTVWEVTQHLIRRLDQKGETETANLKAKIGGMAEIARDLAYRLYTLCERKGWAEEAGYYNSLVVAWPAISNVPELFQVR